AGEHEAAAFTQGDDFFHGFFGIFEHFRFPPVPPPPAVGWYAVNLIFIISARRQKSRKPPPRGRISAVCPCRFCFGGNCGIIPQIINRSAPCRGGHWPSAGVRAASRHGRAMRAPTGCSRTFPPHLVGRHALMPPL